MDPLIRTLLAGILLGGCGPDTREEACAPAPRAPEDLPRFTVTAHDPDRSYMTDSYVLLNQNNGSQSWATLVDGCGAHQWWAPPELSENRIYRAKLARDARSLWIAEKDRSGLVDSAWIRRLNTDGETLSRTRTLEAHHDLVELDDGQLAFLSHQYKQNIWFDAFSEDLVSDVVRLTTEGDETPTDNRLFSLFDDSGIEPFWTCDHMLPSGRVPGFGEWSHSNSLIWEPEEEALYVLIRYWDAILKLDREGEVQWYLGGPRDHFTPVGQTALPKHAHMSEAWPGGLLVFDNRNHLDGPSRVVEYALDEDAGTLQEVFSIPEPEGEPIHYLGDARRLPGGHVLVAWSTKGTVSEYDRDGALVWEIQADHTVGRIQWLPQWPSPDRSTD